MKILLCHPGDISGMEALVYSQFMRTYGIRERINDINNPKIQPLGDVELPRNSLYHYLPSLPGEIGPGNETASFLYTQKGKINMLFDWNYQLAIDPGGVRFRAKDRTKIELGYFKTHFRFTRIRSLAPFLGKEQELIVNNLAPAFINVDYTRKTVTAGYYKHYNEMATIINAVNSIAEISDRHQFWEIKLPNQFLPYQTLKFAFERSKDFFNEDGSVKRISPDVLKHFAANKSYWILDLFAFLQGHDAEQYSVFKRLTPKARERCNFVFSYNGRCIIVGIQTLLNLMAYTDKPDTTEVTPLRINYFKRFYLNLISMVNNVSVATLLGKDDESEKKPEEAETSESRESGRKVSKRGESLDAGSDTGTVDDSLSGDTGNDNVRDNSKGRTVQESGRGVPDEVGENTGGTHQEITDIPLEEEEEEEQGPQWGDDIPDSAFEQVTVSEVSTVIPQRAYTPTSVIERHLQERAKEGRLTERERDYFLSISESYKNIDIEGRTIDEIIDIKPKDMVIDDVTIANDSETIVDKSVLKSRAYVLTQGYVNKMMQRNIVEVLTYSQNAGICLTDLKKERTTTASSKYDVWTFGTQPINGNKRTNKIRIPRVQKDGTFLVNGVKSYMQFQRMEKPVRKVTDIAVQLTSYYDKGRIRVERSKKVVDDYARWLRTRIIGAAQKDPNIKIVLGANATKAKNMCPYYAILAQRFKLLQAAGLTMHFDTDNLIEQDPKVKKFCNEETWCLGIEKGNYLLIDKTGLLTWNGNEDIGYIEDIFTIELNKAPLPISTININGYRFPAVIVLSYWMGFSNLLKAIGADYRVVEPSTRPQLGRDEYLITFADEKLIFNRRDELTTLIVAGLRKLPAISEFSRSHLDDPNIWFGLMDDPKVRPTHFREMTQIYDMFIDPITKRLLEQDKYPTSMEFLCIEAVRLLLTRYAPDETEITEQRIVGYERFAGHIYREICKATRQFRNKPTGGKRTFDINPDSVIMNIITDSSVQAVEEVNPIHQLKQQEEVTYGGSMGRAEQAMVRRTRGMHENYAGIISEAGKDSGKVGFVSFMTVDPKILDYYGNVDVSQKATKAGMGSVTMNTLYGTTKDDTKRTLFAGVQRSQLMATVNYTSNPIRMSYDTVIAQRTNEIYSSVAKKGGTITAIDPEYGMTVKYEDGTEDKFPLGITFGKGAGEYHKHDKVTSYKVGDKFEKGWILAWDDLFFEPDPLVPGKVVVKMCLMSRVVLIEDQASFEDSIAVTKSFTELSAIPFMKVNTVNAYDDEITKLFVKVGDRVEFDQIMCDVEDPTTMLAEEDQDLAGLERYGIKQLKANMSGRVSIIEVLYNGDVESFHPDTQKVIKKYDGQRAKRASYMDDEASNGNVGGNTHVAKVEIFPGSVRINIYLEEILESTTADKLVISNQMKGTIGYIYPFEIKTVDGRPVHVIFSVKSLLARMVLSMRDKLVVNEINNVYTHRLIERIEGSTTWVL